MAEKDAVTKLYMQDSEHFADAVNFGLFQGREIVMPVRSMLSDAAQYMMQIDQLKKMHRKNRHKAESAAEYLSGFYRGIS